MICNYAYDLSILIQLNECKFFVKQLSVKTKKRKKNWQIFGKGLLFLINNLSRTFVLIFKTYFTDRLKCYLSIDEPLKYKTSQTKFH